VYEMLSEVFHPRPPNEMPRGNGCILRHPKCDQIRGRREELSADQPPVVPLLPPVTR
jgi:hypothetical protein